MAQVSFRRATSLPGLATRENNAIYFIPQTINGDSTSYMAIVAVNSTGQVREIGYENIIQTINSLKDQNNGIPALNAQGKISLSVLPNDIGIEFLIVADITERNALNLDKNTLVLVADATGDPNINTGGALYAWDEADSAWVLVCKYEQLTVDISTKADKIIQIIAGNGVTGGGNLEANRTITLGTPSTITSATTNSVTANSHTHALTVTKADVGLSNVTNDAQVKVSDLATQSEAETGTNNTKWMSPLRTDQLITTRLNQAGSGEVNTGANVGSTGFSEVFKDKTGTTLNFRKLSNTGTVRTRTDENDIFFELHWSETAW